MKKGTFIVIEGGEGCGKSTLLEYLREEALKVLWREEKVAFTREPGGSPFAEEIRLLMLGSLSKQANGLTQFGLAWASRADHIKNLIRPHLENGIHVISDRFDSSTYAYQVHG